MSDGSSYDQPRLPLKRLVALAAVVVVMYLAGTVAPPAAIQLLKLIPRDVAVTTHSSPAPTVVTAAVPAPGCTGGLACYQRRGDGVWTRTVTTGNGPKFFEAQMSADTTLTLDGEHALTVTDRSVISRDSGFPAPDATASTTVEFSSLLTGGEPVAVDAERPLPEGLSAFFPYSPERRSYFYFDPLTQASDPLDYVGELTVGELDAYEFHHRLPATELTGDLAAAIRDEFAPALPELGDGDVLPYYAAERTIILSQHTGAILDFSATLHVVLAADAAQAQQLIDAGDTSRTLFATTATWDDATRTDAYDATEPTVRLLRFFQIFAWVTKFIMVSAAVAMIVLIATYRQQVRRGG
ncbi:porin PorA family protein [Corynebacterium uterequi]|uniref:Putative DUF3068 family protein n=1 Tax=Corynebacterium uterequi TaxID=1072256 RepID=A0A0G3HGX4_9CORY|nr:porin PorA family protein [Corynebacterium uterequi]AKK12030.1 putative DUF3068 family protein [Corynebacterium uterequi]